MFNLFILGGFNNLSCLLWGEYLRTVLRKQFTCFNHVELFNLFILGGFNNLSCLLCKQQQQERHSAVITLLLSFNNVITSVRKR